VDNQLSDDERFAENVWAVQQRLPGAREELDAFHDRRADEWTAVKAAVGDLPQPGTVVVCAAPATLRERLAAAPVHHVDTRSSGGR
jgi:hypothetical protein